jgi:hypothetical protein
MLKMRTVKRGNKGLLMKTTYCEACGKYIDNCVCPTRHDEWGAVEAKLGETITLLNKVIPQYKEYQTPTYVNHYHRLKSLRASLNSIKEDLRKEHALSWNKDRILSLLNGGRSKD